MSLIEALVVIGLVGVMSALGTRLLLSARDLWYHQQERAAAARAGWVWAHKIAREVRMGMAPGDLGGGAAWRGTDGGTTLFQALPKARRPEDVGEEFKDLRVDDDTIEFATARVRDSKQVMRPGVVRYALKRDADGRIVGLVRKAAARSDSAADAEGRLVTPDVISLDFQYLDAGGAWRNEWKSGETMPRAVRITVGAFVKKSRKVFDVMRFTTLVYMPVHSRIPR